METVVTIDTAAAVDWYRRNRARSEAIFDLMDEAAVNYQPVLTKIDKLKPGELDTVMAETAERLRRRPAAHPEVLATSSVKSAGLPELRSIIAALIPASGR